MAKKKKTPSMEENLSRFADSGNARNSSVAKFMANIDASPSRKNVVNGRRRRKDEKRVEDKPRYMIDWESTDLNSMKLPRSQGLDIYSGSDSVDTTPSFVGLLDTYTNAAAAYSLRKLRTGQVNAVEVRESGGGTLADIGFDSNGDLDTTALLAHCGANDGFVTTWYDQSGGGNDVTQATPANQPQIVSAGAVITKDGLPAVEFDGTNDTLTNFSSSFINTASVSYFSVSSKNTLTNAGTITAQYSINNVTIRTLIDSSSSAPFRHVIIANTDLNTFFADLSGVRSDTNQRLLSSFIDSSKNMSAFDNGVTGGTSTYTGTTNSNGLSLGSGSGTAYLDGQIQEVVIYNTDQSASREAIESEINTHYTIY